MRRITTYTATFSEDYPSNAKHMGGEKETTDSYGLIVTGPDGPQEAIRVRAFMGRSRNASMVYASIWVRHPHGEWRSGRGSAGGYGYCKFSHAVGEAIDSAGVTLHLPDGRKAYIHGTGENAVKDAMQAIADAMGYPTEGRLLVGM